MRIRKAVFPVGGLGTRFLPATKSIPKEMLPVVDKPLIQYAVEEARDAGIEEFIFVTGRGKSAIEDHFDLSAELEQALEQSGKTSLLEILLDLRLDAGKVSYTRQQLPLGLGHAVWCARHLVGNEPFAVLLADDLILSDVPALKQMIDIGCAEPSIMVAAMEVPPAQTARYGVIDPGDRKGDLIEVKGLVEKPKPQDAPSNLAVIGRYLLVPEVFAHLETMKAGSGGEIQLTDAIQAVLGQVPGYGFAFQGTRFDCGDKLGFLQAAVAFGLQRPELSEEFRTFLAEMAG